MSAQTVRRLTGTIGVLKRRLHELRGKLALYEPIVRAARTYATTGRDQKLLEVLRDQGFEEPPRRTKPQSAPTEEPITEGKPFNPLDGYEII